MSTNADLLAGAPVYLWGHAPSGGKSAVGMMIDRRKLVGFIDITQYPYLAACDGTTDDQAAVQAAIDDASAHTYGVTVIRFPDTANGTLIGSPLTVKSDVTFMGSTKEKTKITRNGAYNIFTAIGVSLNTDGTGAGHIKRVAFQDLAIEGANYASPLLDMRGVDKFSFRRVRFAGSTQELILGYEVYDSRFEDCRFTFGGSTDGTYYATKFASGSDGSFTWELTNHLHFYSCVWEDNQNCSLLMTGSIGSGAGCNECFFYGCKIENLAGLSDQVVFSHCQNLSFFQVQVTTKGAAGNLISRVVKWDTCTGIYGYISWEHTGTVAVNANVDASVSSASPTAASITNFGYITGASTRTFKLFILIVSPCMDKLQGTECVLNDGGSTGVTVNTMTDQNLKKKSGYTAGLASEQYETLNIYGQSSTTFGIRIKGQSGSLNTNNFWIGRVIDSGSGIPRMQIIHNNGSTDQTLMQFAEEGDIIHAQSIKNTGVETVAAAGTTQGTATALTYKKWWHQVSSGTGGVLLPSSGQGSHRKVKNMSGSTITVYPFTGGSIDGGSANAGVTLATGKTMELYALTSNAWQSSTSA